MGSLNLGFLTYNPLGMWAPPSSLHVALRTVELRTRANADTLATAMSMNDILFFVSGSGTFLFSARMKLWQAKFLACK